jgi:hypothetical protein
MEAFRPTPVELYESSTPESSVAFTVEYEDGATDAELRDNLLSYLGEYRLQVQKFDYELDYFADSPFDLGEVRDPNEGESMQKKAQRSIEERVRKGEPIHRETAEYQAFTFLNAQLANAKDGDMLLWASPPGPKEEGYGDYGFLFQGTVKEAGVVNGSMRKKLAMTAIRVDDPTVLQYNQAMSDLTGVQWSINNVDDFLASPVVVDSIPEYAVDHILQKNFYFQLNEDEREMVPKILSQLDVAVNDCIAVFRTGTKAEKLRALYTLENYALELKAAWQRGDMEAFSNARDESPRLVEIMSLYGHEPPKVAGSCGSTTSNPLTFGHQALLKELGVGSLEDLLNNRLFTCPNPKCQYMTDKMIGSSCPGCGLTKQQFAKQGGEVC